ncbi:MAG: metallophosphoesterase [Acidobacteriales bacterium]|nr:metallophosphoesterase [Terriglobales bacterium]
MNRLNRNWIAGLLAVALFAGAMAVRATAGEDNDFHFSIIGDRAGSPAAQVYGRVWREVDMLHPAFVINVGDTIQGGGDAKIEEQWKEIKTLFNRYRQYPLYLVPGNHDVFSEASEKTFVRETGRAVHYGFDYQNAHITVLDNSRGMELSDAELQFLESDLAQHQAQHPKFIFFHKPFWIPLVRVGSGEFALHKLARKYGVDYVVSGHGHTFMRLPFDGVVYMEVGSSGGGVEKKIERGAGFNDGVFFHHVWVYVKGGRVSMTVKELDGQRGQGRMFRAEDWDERGPHFDTGDPANTDKPTT